jgi:hypothetical protein
MKIYFSVDPEVSGGETMENLKHLMTFLQNTGHTIYRGPYVLADDPEQYLLDNFGIRPDDFAGQHKLHFDWIDQVDLLLAEVSTKSEGRSMIIQRALDKPLMGLPPTPVILIKNRQLDRHFGRIVRGLIQDKQVVYFEYDTIAEVENNWNRLLEKVKQI